eukprot:81958_1
MDVRLLGDDNRESSATLPLVTTIKNIKEIIATKLIIPTKHIIDIQIEKMIVSTTDDDTQCEYVNMFQSIQSEDQITIEKYLCSGDTIYINNASSLSDPNVFKVDRAWNGLMDISSTFDRQILMQFVELLTRVCENIIECPQEQKYRHLNYEKIKNKIQNIPQQYGIKIFQCIGFILKPNQKDFNFYIMHSLEPLKHILKCIYLQFPELRPKDAKFMQIFESFDTEQNLFDVEKKEQEEKMQEIQDERKEYYQNLQPNEETIIVPSIGTKIAQAGHVILENAMLLVILLPILWWLIKATFKI